MPISWWCISYPDKLCMILKEQKPLQKGHHLCPALCSTKQNPILPGVGGLPSCNTRALLAFDTQYSTPARMDTHTHTHARAEKEARRQRFGFSPVFPGVRGGSLAGPCCAPGPRSRTQPLPPERAKHGPARQAGLCTHPGTSLGNSPRTTAPPTPATPRAWENPPDSRRPAPL